MAEPLFVTAAVEGSPDEAALRKLCRSVGAELGDVFGRAGKKFILDRLNGFNNSARFRHWVVLVDLDVKFQQVVHSIKTGEADCVEQSSFPGRPNGHP